MSQTDGRELAPGDVPASGVDYSFVLASASPARRRVLADAGINPIVQVSGVDEEALTAALIAERGAIAPADLALALAQAKAQDVARHVAEQPRRLVVGCDSVFELDGIAYGKPLTSEVAIERITAMAGRTGLLHTGHWVVLDGREVGRTATTTVEFAPMRTAEIAAYVATGEPLQVAGSFTLDGRAAPYVRRIIGDPSNVLGISLPTMRDLVETLGVPWPALWGAATGAATG
ncbi:MAG: septum formation inhibitor Maf [Actinomycetales bacterium]|nr:septum formation inhibitor Maf [Actinomycetales bacterium]